MKKLILPLIMFVVCGIAHAQDSTRIVFEDSIKITHYYADHHIDLIGKVGNLVQYYDGCNTHTRWQGNVWSVTGIYCTYTHGGLVNTWHKYKISDKEYVVIHDWHIYRDPNVKEW